MDQIILNREQSRRVDRIAIERYGFTGLVLMENAGRGVADGVCRLCPAAPVAIACGKGNNAGDGFVIARHLHLRGMGVRVLLWADPGELTGDALANFRIFEKLTLPLEVFGAGHVPERLATSLAGAGVIVDALLGTGAKGEPRPPLDAVIDQLNGSSAIRVAVDLPSGLDCDTGRPSAHTIRAAHTFTFCTLKTGLVEPAAQPFTGQVHICDIGVPEEVIREALG